MKNVGITACSNGLSTSMRDNVDNLAKKLEDISLKPIFSEYIYANDSVFQGSGEQRAEALNEFYRKNNVEAVFDISGGDIANETIPYLDFEAIGKSQIKFWGYSDLTTIINAIYAKTGKTSVLYQIRNISKDDLRYQQFKEFFSGRSDSLFKFPYEFVSGKKMCGVIVGGNIRCFLKLAGTPYFPETNGRILLLEALGGEIPQLVTYLSQLKMMGVFENLSGLLLGTFTKAENRSGTDEVLMIIKQFVGDLPIIKTQFVGHGTDSCAVEIGKYYSFE
ncbi:MAG: LD-carboxypeptidase [Clostridia bacterium]|nr:LD-carboxypeptidase [Clostridia bacterium]